MAVPLSQLARSIPTNQQTRLSVTGTTGSPRATSFKTSPHPNTITQPCRKDTPLLPILRTRSFAGRVTSHRQASKTHLLMQAPLPSSHIVQRSRQAVHHVELGLSVGFRARTAYILSLTLRIPGIYGPGPV